MGLRLKSFEAVLRMQVSTSAYVMLHIVPLLWRYMLNGSLLGVGMGELCVAFQDLDEIVDNIDCGVLGIADE